MRNGSRIYKQDDVGFRNTYSKNTFDNHVFAAKAHFTNTFSNIMPYINVFPPVMYLIIIFDRRSKSLLRWHLSKQSKKVHMCIAGFFDLYCRKIVVIQRWNIFSKNAIHASVVGSSISFIAELKFGVLWCRTVVTTICSDGDWRVIFFQRNKVQSAVPHCALKIDGWLSR